MLGPITMWTICAPQPEELMRRFEVIITENLLPGGMWPQAKAQQ